MKEPILQIAVPDYVFCWVSNFHDTSLICFNRIHYYGHESLKALCWSC